MTQTEPETPAAPGAKRTADELDQLAETLDTIIDEAEYKLSGDGRIRDTNREQCRVKWANSAIRAVKVRKSLIEARDLVDMQETIEKIEQEREW